MSQNSIDSVSLHEFVTSSSQCDENFHVEEEIASEISDNNIEDLDLQELQPFQGSSSASQGVLAIHQPSNGTIKTSFPKMPVLDRAFSRNKWNKKSRTIESRCKWCPWKTNSTSLSRLVNHIKSRCLNVPEDEKKLILKAAASSIKIQSSTPQDHQDELLVKALIASYAPLRMLSEVNFIAYQKSIKPDIKILSRSKASSIIIKKLSSRITRDFKQKIERDSDYQVSIEFDHWSDLVHRSVLGVFATIPEGGRYLVKLEDVSLLGHNSQITAETLINILKSLPQAKVNAVASDSAPSCRLAKKIMEDEKDSKLITHRCIAHLVNNIGSMFSRSQPMANLMKTVSGIADYVSNNSFLCAKLSAAKVGRVHCAVKTRWYSQVDMLESLLKAKTIILDHEAMIKKNAKLGEIRSEELFIDIHKAVMIMRPLANCIAVAERMQGSLGEAIKALLDFANSIFSLSWSDELVEPAVSSFLHYFSDDNIGENEFDLIIAAYALDRRFKMDFMTNKAKVRAFNAIVRVAERTISLDKQLEDILLQEFKSMCDQTGSLSKLPKKGESALEWWRKRDSMVLKQVAMRIVSLRSSTANLERLFSVVKLIQGSTRTRFDMKNLERIARIKLSMQNESCLKRNADLNDSGYDDIAAVSRLDTRVDQNMSSQILSGSSGSQVSDIIWQTENLGSEQIKKIQEGFIQIFDFSIVNEFKELTNRDRSSSNRSSLVNRFEGELEKEADAVVALCSMSNQ